MDQYFQSYEDLEVHRLMLSDKNRVLAYKNAIAECPDLFEGKVILDVGAGSGILSILCAAAGAKIVYAVEASKMSEMCEEIVIENHFNDIIEVIHSRIEDVDPTRIGKVDVIISEWMGFYLVHEGMLESVLYARDHFLREGGRLFPSIAKLYAAPCQLTMMLQHWSNFCGVNMKSLAKRYREYKLTQPQITTLKDFDIIGDSKLISWLNLETISLEDINILGNGEYVSVCKEEKPLQGICIWFSVEFPNGTELSTGPWDPKTHWKQTVLVLPTDIKLEPNQPVAFHLAIKKDTTKERKYNIECMLLDTASVEHEIPCSCYMTKCIVTKKYITELESNDKSNLNE